MASQLERCEREWHELEGEFQELQDTHRIYRQKLEELTTLQTSCSSSINKQKTRLKDLKHTLQRYKRHASREEAELVQQLGASIKERQNIFFDMEAYLPKKNGLYLNLVLGNVNVTLLSNQAKFAYKDEYEKFKLYLTIILLLGAVACRFVLHYRIKGWWVSHHYVSTFLSGVMLTWPNGLIYQKFRNQFLAFSIFQSCVQFLQYYYQRGCLYRLRALGERNHLDLTVEGFQSWMWRGLTFLLPFLFCGHFWQLYNAITLFELSSHEECREWQGPAVQSLLQLGPGRPWEGIRKTREPLSGLRNPRRFALGGGPREEPPRTLPDPLGLTPFIQLAQISAFCWQTLQFAGSLCQGGSEVPGGRGGHFSKES
ncbi:transmembrane protein 120B isoform X2 [Eubalaena glacialis]|uniref:transmembrane protein 120B isoform X2 n=1 Tax=Eubalaena glacialis TaxID=27606 RepID=UPI002A5A24EF|nr:transmembrane protein 120B isoform X2 [Eubalaena glacialis]